MYRTRLALSKGEVLCPFTKLPFITKFSVRFFRKLGKLASWNKKKYAPVDAYATHNIENLHGWNLVLCILPGFIVSLIIFMTTSIIYPDLMVARATCPEYIYYAAYTYLFVMMFLWLFSIVPLLKIKDGLGIRLEYSIGLLTTVTLYIIALIASISDPSSPILTKYGLTFWIVMSSLCAQTWFVVFPLVLIYLNHRNIKTSKLSVDKDSLEHIFRSPELMNLFKIQLAKEYTIENGLFIEEYYKIQKSNADFMTSTHNINADINAQANASRMLRNKIKSMFEKYIKSDSPYQLNLTDVTVRQLTEKMDGSHFDLSDISNVYTEVVDVLCTNSLGRFAKANPMMFMKRLKYGERLDMGHRILASLTSVKLKEQSSSNIKETSIDTTTFTLERSLGKI